MSEDDKTIYNEMARVACIEIFWKTNVPLRNSMCMILEFIPNEDKALTILKNMMVCLSKKGSNFYIAKLKDNKRYKFDIWTTFIMEVVDKTRTVGFGEAADKLL